MGRMYGRIRPVRACASCTVATPKSPRVLTTSASARVTFRTTVGFIAYFPLAPGPPRLLRTPDVGISVVILRPAAPEWSRPYDEFLRRKTRHQENVEHRERSLRQPED